MGEKIELYKTMLGSIIAHEQRRQHVATANYSLVIAGVAAVGAIPNLDPLHIALPAVPVAIIWIINLNYSRRLARAKWKIVHELERGFEAQPFTLEWELMKDTHAAMRVKLTDIELMIPYSVLTLSLAYLAWRVAVHVGA